MNIDHGPGFLLGLLFSVFGMGYFAYGKKQADYATLFTGIGLMAFPYFVSGAAATLTVGLALLAAPFAIKRFL